MSSSIRIVPPRDSIQIASLFHSLLPHLPPFPHPPTLPRSCVSYINLGPGPPLRKFSSSPFGRLKMSSEKNNTRVTYKDSSDASLQDEEFAASPQPPTLHRQLKNRHVAMIRYIFIPFPPSSLLITISMQYWWCHRHWPLCRDCHFS